MNVGAFKFKFKFRFKLFVDVLFVLNLSLGGRHLIKLNYLLSKSELVGSRVGQYKQTH